MKILTTLLILLSSITISTSFANVTGMKVSDLCGFKPEAFSIKAEKNGAPGKVNHDRTVNLDSSINEGDTLTANVNQEANTNNSALERYEENKDGNSGSTIKTPPIVFPGKAHHNGTIHVMCQ